jgi:hypothetical protein
MVPFSWQARGFRGLRLYFTFCSGSRSPLRFCMVERANQRRRPDTIRRPVRVGSDPEFLLKQFRPKWRLIGDFSVSAFHGCLLSLPSACSVSGYGPLRCWHENRVNPMGKHGTRHRYPYPEFHHRPQAGRADWTRRSRKPRRLASACQNRNGANSWSPEDSSRDARG